jgi:thiol:disulfide interchange protein
MSIANTLYYDFIYPYKTQFIILFFFVLFSIFGYYAYIRFAKPKIETKNAENISNMAQRPEEIEIYFFYADWCPHCTKAKPEWNAFKNTMSGKEMNGFRINCIETDCTETTPTNSPIIQKFNVDSFPTVKMVKGGKQISFDSRLTNDTLTKFVTTMLNA